MKLPLSAAFVLELALASPTVWADFMPGSLDVCRRGHAGTVSDVLAS